jgi:hypothetical protein
VPETKEGMQWRRQSYLPVSTSTDNNSNSTGDAAVRQSAFSLNDEDASARGGHGSDDERSRGGMVGLPSGGVASLGLYEVQLQPQNDTPIGGNGGSSPGPVGTSPAHCIDILLTRTSCIVCLALTVSKYFAC